MKLAALVTSLAVAAPAALAFAPSSNPATGRTQQLAASQFENESEFPPLVGSVFVTAHVRRKRCTDAEHERSAMRGIVGKSICCILRISISYIQYSLL